MAPSSPPTLFALCAALFVAVSSAPAAGPGPNRGNALPPLRWQHGPGSVALGELASLRLPPGHAALDAEQTRAFMEKLGNPPTGREVGMVAPTNLAWFAVFQFDAVGYVSNAEKSRLNSNAIFKAVLQMNALANTERVRRGWPEARVTGWELPPTFHAKTMRMEWALRGESGNESSVNHGIRILGRSGIIEVSLVERHRLASNGAHFKSLLDGVEFRPGERYRDHQPGDKLAPYGLSGLITRGQVPTAKGLSFLREIHWRVQKFWWFFLLIGLSAGWIAGLLLRLHWLTRMMEAGAARAAGCQLVETPATPTTPAGPAADIENGPKRKPVRLVRRLDSYAYYQHLTRDLYR